MDKHYKEHMVALLENLGADRPKSFLSSEEKENIPQVAHFLFVHEARKILAQSRCDGKVSVPQEVNPDAVIRQGETAMQEVNESGASLRLLSDIYQAGACAAIFEMLNLLDGTFATDGEEETVAPHWALMEVIGKLGEGKLTGRTIGGTHEYFFCLYDTD
jgi:hypothetical protein